MNPIDHPHGGGQGKTSWGRPSVSIYGRLTKNVPTRKNKSITN
jgi:large subunit ribosomal protein L2